MRTVWVESDGASLGIIDQTLLPHRFATIRLATLDDVARAIATMQVRGAPLIGAAAAYGLWLALRADASDEALDDACADPDCDASDGHQSQMGAGRIQAAVRKPAARRARGSGLTASRRDRR
jgi:methylthioribose-1-phosphate isomerase